MIGFVGQVADLRRARKLVEGFSPVASNHSPLAEGFESSPSVVRWTRLADSAGITFERRKKIELYNVWSWGISGVIALSTGTLTVFLLPFAVSFFTVLWCRRLVTKRLREFDRDYPTFLTTLSSTVRTGMDPRKAFQEAVNFFPDESVISIEANRMLTAWNGGENDERAIALFASTVEHPDVELLRAATRLALSHGTSFSECLHRLARVTRARQSFRRKVRAALAMQRLSAAGIGLSALCIAGLQVATNRNGLTAVLEHPSGKVLLTLGIGLVLTGIVWMTRIGLKNV